MPIVHNIESTTLTSLLEQFLAIEAENASLRAEVTRLETISNTLGQWPYSPTIYVRASN